MSRDAIPTLIGDSDAVATVEIAEPAAIAHAMINAGILDADRACPATGTVVFIVVTGGTGVIAEIFNG
jgi:hypothetical protein